MVIQQIRNATLKIKYGGITFLIDPGFRIREPASPPKPSSRKCKGSNAR